MLPRFVAFLAVILTLAACTDAPSPAPSTFADDVSTSATPHLGLVEAGRLAVIEADGTVAVIDPDGSSRVALTGEGPETLFTQPIWSPDSSRIAFGQVGEDEFSVRIREVDGDGDLTIPVSNNPFYMFWSPDGESLGVLHNGRDGLDFEVVDISEGTITVLDSGSPFYFTWSPDGDRVAIHEGVDRFEEIDLEGASSSLGDTGGGYLAPQWLPDGILHVVDDRLVMTDHGEPSVLAEVGEQTFFVANHDGSLVAVQSLGARGQAISYTQSAQLDLNVVSVIDTASLEAVTVDTELAAGFWWSPDGRSLLLLTPFSDGTALMAKVWSEETGLVEYARYRPSPIQARDLLPFFPQYAQSMTFWAPDSSGFAISGEFGGEIGVWVQDLDASEPMKVSDGLWVAWSPG